MKVLCRRRGFTIWELLVILVIIGIFAALLLPVFRRARNPHPKASCQSNLKQIGLGFMQYMQDYDSRWPRVAAFAVSSSTAPFLTPYGWADALQPYMKTTTVLQCPSEENPKAGIDGVRAGFTDYYSNTNISGVSSKDFAQPAATLLCGDGNDGTDGTDARYNRNVLPRSWLKNEGSPARREVDGGTYLFADGHTKWTKPNVIKPTASPMSSSWTFRLR